MKRVPGRRIAAVGGLVALAVVSFLALRGMRGAASPGSTAADAGLAAAGAEPSPAMRSPDRPTPPAALGPDPSDLPRRQRGEITSGLAQQAAEDYRRRARYPQSSHPLATEDEDPIARDREVSPVRQAGPDGAEPALVVLPAQVSFEAPEPVVLYAYLAVGDRPVPAVVIRGTLMTEDLQPLGEFEYVDDGTGGDAIAGDDVRTAAVILPEELRPELSASYLVKVRAITRSDQERLAATSFQYANPHARLTGRYRDALVDGSLEIAAEVDVTRSGRFHLEGTLYGAGGADKVAWAQTAAELDPGRHWMTLPFYGLALRERGVDGPYLLRYLALSTATAMPNAKNRVVENAFRTAAYRSNAFSDRSFGDPDLTEAADRLEREPLKDLEAGG